MYLNPNSRVSIIANITSESNRGQWLFQPASCSPPWLCPSSSVCVSCCFGNVFLSSASQQSSCLSFFELSMSVYSEIKNDMIPAIIKVHPVIIPALCFQECQLSFKIILYASLTHNTIPVFINNSLYLVMIELSLR